MAEALIPERAAVTARGFHHTRWLLLYVYTLAFVWGARNIYFWKPSKLDLLTPVAIAIVLAWWAIIDARMRRHPVPLLAQAWFVLAAGFFVPGYILWSRRWRGAGWLVLHALLCYVLAAVVMNVGSAIIFGRE